MKRREAPIKRVNPSGQVVWLARYTDSAGRRRSAGTTRLKRDAQALIDAAYYRPLRIDTVGAYFERWPHLHPRAKRTQRTNEHRISRALDVAIEGRLLRDWPLIDLRRRHAYALVDHLLTVQGRAALGAQGILRALSVMAEDAITDDLAELNPWRGVTVRRTDPRVTKAPRKPYVVEWEVAHRFAAAAAVWRADKKPNADQVAEHARREGLIRVASDCGLRLGELLALERADLVRGECGIAGCGVAVAHLHVRRTTHEGDTIEGTKHDHDKVAPGRIVPVPASTLDAIDRAPPRLDTPLLFPTQTGKLRRERNFYRDVWAPARVATGLTITPHDLRHSWITQLRAEGINVDDLAAMAGHTVETMLGTYSHALGRSFELVREAVG